MVLKKTRAKKSKIIVVDESESEVEPEVDTNSNNMSESSSKSNKSGIDILKPNPIKFNVIERSKKKIRYIVHLADIHIRKHDRVEEYKYVFDKLFTKLRELKLNNDNSVIYVAGDVIHNKLELTPSSIHLVKDFFIGLSEISTVVCILGNHDVNIHNKNVDSITPIIGKAFKTKYDVHVLNEDCVYEYNNILFGVTTLFNTSVTNFDLVEDDILKNKHKIGLYHGTVAGSVTESGHEMENTTNNRYFNQSDFDCYDFTLLGDIHKHQYLNKNKTIIYAGSLIQQTRAESYNNKGFELVDLLKGKTKFHPIKNKFGMVNVIIEADGTTNLDDDFVFPEELDVKIICKTSDRNMINTFCDKVQESGSKIIECSQNIDYSGCKLDTTIDVGSEEVDISNLRDKNKMTDLIVKCINKENNDNSPEFDYMVIKTINNILENHEYETEFKCKHIKLKSLEFNNMMIYGRGNSLNFDLFNNKIMGLTASNNSGKSSLIDILLFAIYGEFRRDNMINVINRHKSSCSSVVVLDVNDKTFMIRRIYERNGKIDNLDHKAGRTHVKLFEDDVEISEAEAVKTNQIIKQKICSYDDLITYAIMMQQNSVSFIHLDNKQKKDRLCQIIGLEIFDLLFSSSESLGLSKKREITSYEKDILKMFSDYVQYSNKKTSNIIIDSIGKLIETNKGEYEKQKTEMDNAYEQKQEELKQLKTNFIELELTKQSMGVNFDFENNAYTDEDHALLQEIKDELTEQIDDLTNKIEAKSKTVRQCNAKIKKFDNIETVKEEFDADKKNRLDEKRKLLGELYTKLSNTTKKFNSKKLLSMKKDYDKKSESINNKINALNDKKQELKNNLVKLPLKKATAKLKSNYDTYLEQTQLLSENEKNKLKLDKELTNLLASVKEFDGYEFDAKCKFCVKNSLTKQKVYIDGQIDDTNKNIKKLETEILKINKYLEKNENHKTDYEEYEENKQNNEKINSDLEVIELKLQNENQQLELLELNKNEIDEMEALRESHQQDIQTKKQINELTEEIDEIEEEECEEYDLYMAAKEKRTNAKEVRSELENKKLNLTIQLDENEIKLKSFDKNKKLYDKMKNMDDTYDEQNNNICELENELFKQKQQINKMVQLIEHSNTEQKMYETMVNNLNAKRKELAVYKAISSVLNNKTGLIGNILKKVVVQLEKIVNEIVANVNLDKIKIVITDKGIHINRCNGSDDGNDVSLALDGGGMSHIYNIIFRIVLNQLNNCIRPDFMIFDEAFDACDPDSKNKVKKLIESIKSFYSWLLVVSHDTDIQAKFDEKITIEPHDSPSDKKCKKIKYI